MQLSKLAFLNKQMVKGTVSQCRGCFMESPLTIYVHELRSVAKRTSEQQTFSDTLQRMSKYLSWCYLFTSLVLRTTCETLRKKSYVLNNTSQAKSVGSDFTREKKKEKKALLHQLVPSRLLCNARRESRGR